MQVYILIDNNLSDKPHVQSEHGLSLLIHTGGKSFLMDAGLTGQAFANAAHLGLDVHSLSAIILSHGHNDHCGGLLPFIQANPSVAIYASDHILHRSYSSTRHGHLHDISASDELMEEVAKRIVDVDTSIPLAPNAMAVRCRDYGFIRPSGNKYLQADSHPYMADDEVALALRGEEGLTVVSPCSHGGMLNIIRSCMEATGENHVSRFIGGLHLLDEESEHDDIPLLCSQLLDMCPDIQLFTGHCTGSASCKLLSDSLDPRFHLFHSGATI